MRALRIGIGILILTPLVLAGVLRVLPRPADTTEARVFQSDGASIDYCAPPELSVTGLLANEIPVAYTPGCAWERFPMPVLEHCSEPLAPGVEDFRGLWQANAGLEGHVERIEQCGNRVVVTAARVHAQPLRGIIHDMRADGTLRNGANDVGPRCLRIFAAAEWREGVLQMRPFGGPVAAVTRRLDGDELVWFHPAFGTTRMQRICALPEP